MDYIIDYLSEPVEINLPVFPGHHPDKFRFYLLNKIKFNIYQSNNKDDYWNMEYHELIDLLKQKINALTEYHHIISPLYSSLCDDIIIKYYIIYQITDILIYRCVMLEQSIAVLKSLLDDNTDNNILNLSYIINFRIIFYLSYHIIKKFPTKYKQYVMQLIKKIKEIKNDPKCNSFFFKEELIDYKKFCDNFISGLI